MKLDSNEFSNLTAEYPFLADVAKGLARACSAPDNVDFKLTVKEADADLMFKRADNIGVGDDAFMFRLDDKSKKYKDLIGRKLEKAFALDSAGRVLVELNWPINRNDKNNRNIYCQNVFWRHRTVENHLTTPIHDEAASVAWMSCESWHVDKKVESGDRFGESKLCEIHLTVHRAPSEGFRKLTERANVYENLELTSRTLTDAIFDKDWDINCINGCLYELCVQFQEDVYFNGMKTVLDEKSTRGCSGELGIVKVMSAEMCGYHRVMLEADIDGESVWASLQLRPEATGMYVLGCQGTLPRLRKMIRTACREWPTSKRGFKKDNKVSVM
jgi:hypothetical protein